MLWIENTSIFLCEEEQESAVEEECPYLLSSTQHLENADGTRRRSGWMRWLKGLREYKNVDTKTWKK